MSRRDLEKNNDADEVSDLSTILTNTTEQ